MGIFGDILSSITQVAGSAADRRYNERMTREAWGREDSQLQRLMRDANAAGIHPVAALGAGANYGSTQAMQPSGLGDALGSAAVRISEGVARRQEQAQDIALRREELALEGQRLANEKAFYEAQMLADARSRTLFSEAIGAVRSPLPPVGGPVAPAGNQLGAGRGWTFGDATPAQVFEDQYGDILGGMYGFGNWIRDLLGNDTSYRRLIFAPTVEDMGGVVPPGWDPWADPQGEQILPPPGDVGARWVWE